MGGMGGQGCYCKLGSQGRPPEKVRKRADLQDVRTNQLTGRVSFRQSRQGEYKTQGGRARPAEGAARKPGAGAVWTRGWWQAARPWAFSALLVLLRENLCCIVMVFSSLCPPTGRGTLGVRLGFSFVFTSLTPSARPRVEGEYSISAPCFLLLFLRPEVLIKDYFWF